MSKMRSKLLLIASKWPKKIGVRTGRDSSSQGRTNDRKRAVAERVNRIEVFAVVKLCKLIRSIPDYLLQFF